MTEIKDYPNGIPTDNDLLVYQSALNNGYYNCKKGDVIINGWNTITTNAPITKNTVINATVSITVTLPANPNGIIELLNLKGNSIKLNWNNKKYNSNTIADGQLEIIGVGNLVKLLYIDDIVGWYLISGNISFTQIAYAPGSLLHLDNGSFTDKSGNNRNAALLGTGSPSTSIGLDGKQVLRFNGTSDQELQIPYFLSSTIGATLYCVYTINSTDNYNLIRTANLDDYWRFAPEDRGYIGTFSGARITGYPASMPSSGSHLISIHSTGNTYEAVLDNVSKGVVNVAYNSGDRFRISTNDKKLNGDIALILVYPHLAKTSETHLNNVSLIKQQYPSLPFTL